MDTDLGSNDLAGMVIRNRQDRDSRYNKGQAWQSWSAGPVPEWVLLVPCEGVPFYTNYKAYIPTPGGKRKGFYLACRCENGRNPGAPCLLHDIWRKDSAARQVGRDWRGNSAKPKSKSPYFPREYYGITVVRWSYFHYVPEVEDQGDGTIKIAMRWQQCKDDRSDAELLEDGVDDTDCQLCTENARIMRAVSRVGLESYCRSASERDGQWAREHRRDFGMRRYMNMGPGYFDSLVNAGRELSRKCRCGGEIKTVRYVCPVCRKKKPEAPTVLMDPRTTTLSPDEVSVYWSREVKCPTCGYRGAPYEEVRCTAKCGRPSPRRLWDQPIKLQKQGEDTTTLAVLEKMADIIDIEKLPDSLKKKCVPYNFEEMLSTTTAEQAELLGIPDPYTAGRTDEEDANGDGTVKPTMSRSTRYET